MKDGFTVERELCLTGQQMQGIEFIELAPLEKEMYLDESNSFIRLSRTIRALHTIGEWSMAEKIRHKEPDVDDNVIEWCLDGEDTGIELVLEEENCKDFEIIPKPAIVDLVKQVA
jgi:hypothetical protein